ncbi:maleylpyruvate isomerase family mycothiol-dependent enzyme [Actinoplanes sp. NPDC026670]|uniref:maleylpyruvate isomerase family mycothiol-dependent enzyme n=1 Tax=Actinoplanes sp. NPDC026670 TaxID=3154700 RepID=UPI0033CDC7DF
MNELTAEQARRAIVEYTRRMADAAVTSGPDTVVPTTPGWTVTEVVEHLGQTQHWVAEIIERRITDPAKLPTGMAVLPGDPEDWPAWLAGSAERVANAFAGEALDAEVFNAAGDERTGARFWMSSVLNETVVHGFDVSGATDIDAGVAAALVSNHLAMLTSPTWNMLRSESAHALRGDGQTLQWRATDIDGAWFVQRRPDGANWQQAIRPADVTVAGPASALLLTLTRRLPLGGHRVTVDGDAELVRHWLGNTAHVAG